MMNNLAKSLVLLHTVLSVAGMGWAIMLTLQGRDLGWMEPYQEVFSYGQDGKPKAGETARYASEYDKSLAALQDAARVRDRTYVAVKPAIDSIRTAEPYLANNHLYYVAELKRLREATEKIVVRRNKEAGAVLETPIIGKPVPEDQALANITESHATYMQNLKKIIGEVHPKTLKKTQGDIDGVEADIRKLATDTKELTFQLTGTDETNKYVQPGLYQLTDQEFKAQSQLKVEIEEIRPNWSKAVEQSRLFRFRFNDLDAQLKKLKAVK
ncbi:MAG: hypothetical protein EXR98_02025 [Gemmataceae bacterium]|nr:hypothetical protein [Gemmataceae bacterium]